MAKALFKHIVLECVAYLSITTKKNKPTALKKMGHKKK